MTWISGPCDPRSRTLFAVPDDADRELLLLASCEVGYRAAARPPQILHVVEPGDVESDRELFSEVAATAPGVIRTLSVLAAELADVELSPELLSGLGGHLYRLGDTLAMSADRLTIDAT